MFIFADYGIMVQIWLHLCRIDEFFLKGGMGALRVIFARKAVPHLYESSYFGRWQWHAFISAIQSGLSKAVFKD